MKRSTPGRAIAAGGVLFLLTLPGIAPLHAEEQIEIEQEPGGEVTVLESAPAAEGAPEDSSAIGAGPETHPLLVREPLGYDLSTIKRLRRSATRLPSDFPYLIDALGEQWDVLGASGSLLIFLLLAAIPLGLLAQRLFAARLESILRQASSRLPRALQPWVSATAQVLAAGLIPLSLWGLYRVIARATEYDHPWFLLIGGLLLAWTRFAFTIRTVRELVMRPLIPIAPEHGRYLYGVARWLVLYAVFQSALVEAMWDLGVGDDFVSLFGSLFHLTLLLLLTVFLARKRAVMALFPNVPNRLYQTFVRALGRFYPIALALTAGVALLAWAGYTRLANFIWIRTWAVVALFLGAVLIHQLLRKVLEGRILRDAADREAAVSFLRSTERLLDYIGAVAVVLITLQLVGIQDPLVGILSRPIYSVGERPVSLLALFEAAVIAAGFLFFSRLIRSYLDYQVYPSLRVEEGIAHAVNAFILYAMAIAGVMLALQVVGIGIGSLTIFAGALGIGLGFGLQAIANNLASGLILTFSRGLRKGDWVTVGDTIGVIQEVGIRATRLRTRDAIEYMVPNSEFVNATLVNWTFSSPHFRLHVPVGVSYGSDPDQVREILIKVAAEHPDVAESPAPDIWFVGFGDSSLNFELLVWVNAKQVGPPQVQSDLYFGVFRALKEAGIEIPFPQRDIHIRSDARARWPRESEREAEAAIPSQTARRTG